MSKCFVPLILLVISVAAQSGAAAEPGYAQYMVWSDWARWSTGLRPGLASSYDRSGDNNDYNHYEWPEGLLDGDFDTVAATVTGPGVFYRFWMPHRTANQHFPVRMYFDGEATPRIDTFSDELFATNYSYFDAPFVDTCAGGQVCYEPLPFAQSLRIETANFANNTHYYQYTYLRYPAGTALESYSGTLTPTQSAERAAVAQMFAQAGQHPAGTDPNAVRLTTGASPIPAGGALVLADLAGSATIRQISVRMDAATDEQLSGLFLRITYDEDALPAVDVNVAEFFGAGYQRAAYRSLPLGTDSPDGFYCYWPMPFRYRVQVALHNATAAEIPIDAAVVEYVLGPLAVDMCYLHAHAYSEQRQDGQIYHPMLSATGRGHYVGNLLYIDQDSYSFSMLEGDEVIEIDDELTLYGTGSEDAYNGGYYYNWVAIQLDEPEGPYPQAATRPLSGILHVHRAAGVPYARADQYRWQIADRVPFANSIDVKIENRYSIVGARWTSVAFWYQQPPVPADADADGDLDLADFAAFQGCYASVEPACIELCDIDHDGVVNSADFAAFTELMTWPW
ncbi:MAG: DUF2961 domain-containing protein [Planctomycetota bacterium]